VREVEGETVRLRNIGEIDRQPAGSIETLRLEVQIEPLGRIAELSRAGGRELRLRTEHRLTEIEFLQGEAIDDDTHRQFGQDRLIGDRRILLGRQRPA
jgi:hypothetical protein